MKLNDYQIATGITAVYPRDRAQEYVILGLSSEAGELAGARKKFVRGDYGPDEYRSMVEKELGDVLWYAARVAEEHGLDLKAIAVANLYKLADRKRRGALRGSGDDR